MALFGRRANQQSTKPEVPPELRPYLDGQSRAVRIRHALGRLAPLFVAIILSGAIIGGAVWWRDNHKMADSQTATTTTKPKPQVAQNGQPAPSSSQPTTTQQAQPATTTPQTSSTSTSTPSTPSNNTPAIPNTGPGGSVLAATLTVAAIATVLSYVRQLRRLEG